MKAYGLIFGSFNPVHNLHIELAQRALRDKEVDKVLFIPAKQNPFKKTYEISDKDRLTMLKLARLSLYPSIDYFGVEFLEGPLSNKTYDVLNYIKDHFIWNIKIICGSDTYKEIPSWYKGEEIINNNSFVVYGRDPKDVSSTQIRELIKNHKDFKDLVPLNVYNYIKQNHLYVDSKEI